MTTYIFIDGSYFVFFRYYALKMWWKMAHPECENMDLSICDEFLEKYRRTFVDTVAELPKKLGLVKAKRGKKMTDLVKEANIKILVAQDCERQKIWRMKHYPEYKGTRVTEDGDKVGTFFKIAYEEKLFELGGASQVLKHDSLEADDIIAISIKQLNHYSLEYHSNFKFYIIASDMDYLQLACDNIQIFDLKYKNIREKKSSCGDAMKDLFMKCVCGDKSDNIPSIFPKCGKKTAEALYEMTEEERIAFLATKPGATETYNRNKLIIDFINIPDDLAGLFLDKNFQNMLAV